MHRAADPVRLAVLTSRMQGIVRGMMNTLFRTARSGVINTARDFSACIVTREDELLVAAESLPIHVMVGPDIVAGWMKRFHPCLRAGDAFLHNSPYHGNSHAGDHSLLAPVVDAEGNHRFTVYVKAHVADTGNSLPTTIMPSARDVYEEGALIFPCVKVQEAYEDIDDVIRMCQARIRVPDMWRGDLLAMLGAVRTAERELLKLGTEVGWNSLHEYTREWLDYSEMRMEDAIRALPAGGRRVGRTFYDSLPFPGVENGLPIEATAEVFRDEGVIEIDCRNNPDCVQCGINLTEATARSAAMVGVFNSIGAGIPPNGGSFRRLKVRLRENCVCGIPVHPFSCSTATTGVADRLAGAVQLAMAQFGESIGMAEAGGCLAAADSIISGCDPRRSGAPFVDMIILGVTGGPGNPWSDGWLYYVGGCAGMILRDSKEIDELLHPIRFEEDRIVPNSEGAGARRGAPSNLVEYAAVDTAIELACASEGTRSPALGARGGLPGAVGKQFKRRLDGQLEPVESPALVVLEAGESIVSYSGGGGGYGTPTEREVERVLKDVQEGYITCDRARAVYAVVITQEGEVDVAETERLRTERRRIDEQPAV